MSPKGTVSLSTVLVLLTGRYALWKQLCSRPRAVQSQQVLVPQQIEDRRLHRDIVMRGVRIASVVPSPRLTDDEFSLEGVCVIVSSEHYTVTCPDVHDPNRYITTKHLL